MKPSRGLWMARARFAEVSGMKCAHRRRDDDLFLGAARRLCFLARISSLSGIGCSQAGDAALSLRRRLQGEHKEQRVWAPSVGERAA